MFEKKSEKIIFFFVFETNIFYLSPGNHSDLSRDPPQGVSGTRGDNHYCRLLYRFDIND